MRVSTPWCAGSVTSSRTSFRPLSMLTWTRCALNSLSWRTRARKRAALSFPSGPLSFRLLPRAAYFASRSLLCVARTPLPCAPRRSPFWPPQLEMYASCNIFNVPRRVYLAWASKRRASEALATGLPALPPESGAEGGGEGGGRVSASTAAAAEAQLNEQRRALRAAKRRGAALKARVSRLARTMGLGACCRCRGRGKGGLSAMPWLRRCRWSCRCCE